MILSLPCILWQTDWHESVVGEFVPLHRRRQERRLLTLMTVIPETSSTTG